MLKKTVELKKKIQELDNLQEKLAVLHGAYHGETCYLITCGPSINDIWNKRIEEILDHNLAIAVKQAYDLAPHVMDFHLLNPWNYKIYEYPEPKPITVTLQSKYFFTPLNLVYDLDFSNPLDSSKPEPLDHSKPQASLALNRNFDDYLFTKRLDRPWGPGIVYELGIYLAIHLGVSELIVVGWDIGEPTTNTHRHFYDKAQVSGIKEKPSTSSLKRLFSLVKKRRIALVVGRKLLPLGLRNRLFYIYSTTYYFDNSTGEATKVFNTPIYNTPLLYNEEIELIADSTEELYYWLRNKGIDLKIVSDRSLVHPCVPRIKL